MYVIDEMRTLLLAAERPPPDGLLVDMYSSEGLMVRALSDGGFIRARWSEPYGRDVLIITNVTQRGTELIEHIAIRGCGRTLKSLQVEPAT
jgi:hypothetical protein